MAKLITIVVPVFNEEGSVAALHHEVRGIFAELEPTYEYRIVFVDDGSRDGSVGCIRALMAQDPRVTCIELSRNFGKEAALSAGIAHAAGDAAILMDADLQHPPAIIKKFLAQWEQGAEVVIGVRARNPDEHFLRKASSRSFAYLMRMMGDVAATPGATDFRLIDRMVIDAFNCFTEHERLTRGLIDWLGFRRTYVYFDAHKRHAGSAQYGYRKLASLALSALIAHSMVPLRLAGYLGLLITLFAGLLGFFILAEQIILGDPLALAIPATAMLAVMIMFLNGILLVSIGLVSRYIEQIHYEAKNRPLYVVRSEHAHAHEPDTRP